LLSEQSFQEALHMSFLIMILEGYSN